jgi:hypothetical protein
MPPQVRGLRRAYKRRQAAPGLRDVRAGNGTVLASNGHLHDALPELVRGIPDARDYRAVIHGDG